MFSDGALAARPGWLDGQGPSADIVVSTRARVARNLPDHAFPHHLDEDELNRVRREATERLLATETFAGGWALDLAVLEPLERLALRESHLASRDLLREYVPQRIVPEGVVVADLAEELTRAAEIRDELWVIAEELATTTPNYPDPTALAVYHASYTESLNETIDVATTREVAGIYARVPETVLLLLFVGSTGAVVAQMNTEEVPAVFVAGTVIDDTATASEGHASWEQTVEWSDPRLPPTLKVEADWYIYGAMPAGLEDEEIEAVEDYLVMVTEMNVRLADSEGSWRGSGRAIAEAAGPAAASRGTADEGRSGGVSSLAVNSRTGGLPSSRSLIS